MRQNSLNSHQEHRLSTPKIQDRLHDSAGNVHGSMTAMPSIPGGLTWDPHDRLQKTDHHGGGVTYFVYDSTGMRVRKVHRSQAGTTSKERLYLGPWETYRETSDLLGTPTLDLERETLHLHDPAAAACLLETKTVDNAAAIQNPTTHHRYQHQTFGITTTKDASLLKERAQEILSGKGTALESENFENAAQEYAKMIQGRAKMLPQ